MSDLQHGTRPVSVFLAPEFADVSRLAPMLGTMTECLVARFSAQQETPGQKVGLFLDEMGNLGHLAELAQGQSFLQGAGVQTIQVWQNLLQFRETYGPTSPLLASVGTQVYYTPSDHETAEWISAQLGVTTERLHLESRSFSFWGLFTSSTIGTSEHRRELLTADEVRRLDESAALVVSKGTAPILATKLGVQPPEVIDLAKPMLKKVAGIAAALLLGFGVTTYALWPASTSLPRLSMSSGIESPTPEPTPAPTGLGSWLTADDTLTWWREQPAFALFRIEDNGRGKQSLGVVKVAKWDECHELLAQYAKQVDELVIKAVGSPLRRERLGGDLVGYRDFSPTGTHATGVFYLCAHRPQDEEPLGSWSAPAQPHATTQPSSGMKPGHSPGFFSTSLTENLRAAGGMVLPGLQEVTLPKPWTLHEQKDVVVLDRAPTPDDWKPGAVMLSAGIGRPGHFASRRDCEFEIDQRLAGQANGAVIARPQVGRMQGFQRDWFVCVIGHGVDTQT